MPPPKPTTQADFLTLRMLTFEEALDEALDEVERFREARRVASAVKSAKGKARRAKLATRVKRYIRMRGASDREMAEWLSVDRETVARVRRELGISPDDVRRIRAGL